MPLDEKGMPVTEETVPFRFHSKAKLAAIGTKDELARLVAALLADNADGIGLECPVLDSLGGLTLRTDGNYVLEDRPGMTHGIDFASCVHEGRQLGRCRVTYRSLPDYDDESGLFIYPAVLWPSRNWQGLED